jgi:Trp operon repressor
MSATSKKYFSREFKNLIWKDFLKKIKSAKTEDALRDLLDTFFTENEKFVFEKRLAILYLLTGKDYREISREVDVSPKTIYFVKEGLKYQPKTKRSPMRKESMAAPKKIKRKSKFPTYRGRGRWRFLNM